MVQISFIIPLYNCLPLTQAMLASLRATLPQNLGHEIILVDDGSTDGTREWLKVLPAPCRVLLNEKNLGFAGACNRGAAAAQGEFLFFLNNDLVLLPGWLEPMLAAFARYADAGLVGNVQLNHSTGAIDHAGIFFNPKGKPEHLVRPGLPGQISRRVDALTGACFAVRRELWSQLGGFDIGYINGCEDVDLCLRALQTGRRNLVALGSRVRHHISASIGRKLRDEHNTLRLFRRWGAFIATRISHSCARECLEASWTEPRDYADGLLARDAFLHLVRLTPAPSARLLAAARAKLDLELAHWAHVLDGAAVRPRQEVAWQYFPLPPKVRPEI